MKNNLSEFIYRKTVQNQGCSINLDGREPESGFMVSYQNTEKRVKLFDFSAMHIESFIRANLGSLHQRGNFIGTWIDNDIVFIDISFNVPDRQLAITLARKFGQIAIFDVNEKKSIYL